MDRQDKLVRAMLASAEGFRSLAYAAGGVGQTVGGVLCWHSQSRVPLFNGAAIVSSTQINPDTLDALFDYFTRWDPLQLYSVLTLDDLTPGALRQMSHYGYKEYEHFPTMWIDLNPGWESRYASAAQPPELTILRVEQHDHLVHFRSVLRRVFHMPADEVELVMSDKALEVGNVRHYIGMVGREPVATATAVLGGEVAGVWNVGTLPEWERKGVGSALMRHLLSDAHSLGHRASMLLSSPQGVRFYSGLGYCALSTMRVSSPDLERETWLRFAR